MQIIILTIIMPILLTTIILRLILLIILLQIIRGPASTPAGGSPLVANRWGHK